ncbi:hypothetical protein FACS1894170_06340 [Planctomycetales bacterium]|nr:hypothetical protein FACS1894170_06340 [Planctomycetales bacterium]
MQQIFITAIYMLCIFGNVLAEESNVQTDRESRIRLPKSDAHYKEAAGFVHYRLVLAA